MSLLFNTLARSIIAFLPRSKHLLISWLQPQSAVIFMQQWITATKIYKRKGRKKTAFWEYWILFVYFWSKLWRRQWHPTPPHSSTMENPMDGGAWKAAVHGVAEGRTQLSDFTLTFHFHALEKEMATHSTVLAWRIPGTGEPGGLPSMGSHRVGHDWSDLAA